MTDILLIDKDPARSSEVTRALHDQGVCAVEQQSIPSVESLTQYACLVILDTIAVDSLKSISSRVPTIVISDQATIPAAVTSMRCGALDYLAWPVAPEVLLAAVERASTSSVPTHKNTLDNFPMIGSSESMQTLKQSIAKVAPTNSTILILGQSGTGKELVARALHSASNRAAAPMISINCATIPHSLIEAELFGLEQYDANLGGNRGLIEAAEGGTLFLDEIADLPAAAQARLLRVLQGQNRRVGSVSTAPVNVRIIAATHRNLAELTEQGKFREDLFYRLNVVCFDIPPLRQRAEDIHEIAAWLLERTCERLNKEGLSFTAESKQAMADYHWPGNVRELENAVERAVILADEHSEITQSLLAIHPTPATTAELDPPMKGDQTSLEDYFMRFVLDNQEQCTETELAEKLGISRKSLWERRQRLNIPRRKTRKRGPRRDDANT